MTVVQSVYFDRVSRTELEIRTPKFHILVPNSYNSWFAVSSKRQSIIVHNGLIVIRDAQIIQETPTVLVKLV